jgi:hypothetical protein
MARPKTRAPARPGWLARLISFLRGRGRPLVIAGLMLGTFAAVWHWVWSDVRAQVLGSPDYYVSAARIEISPLPPWIHSDIREDVFGALSSGGPLSILDDNLTERVAATFALHPWVAKVRRVTKQHPARLVVEVDYRRPVLVVDTVNGLLPVDEQGVLLPAADFSPIEKSRFPRLVGADTAPLGSVGERWGDPRVFGAAQIVAAIGPAWNTLQLSQIVASIKPISGAEDYTYVLATRKGSTINWGRAPHTSGQQELPAAEKLARLMQYFNDHGTLDGRERAQELDVVALKKKP